MIKGNPLFSKDSLKRAARYICNSIDMHSLGGGDRSELHKAKWIIASIMDYVFQFLPVECYIFSSVERSVCSEHLEEFLRDPDREINTYVDTLKKEKPRRLWNLEDIHTISVLKEIKANKDEILTILTSYKKQELPKPTKEEISYLSRRLHELMDNFQESTKGNLWDPDIRNIDSTPRKYINTLAIAWQHYGYGAARDIFYGEYMEPLVLIRDTQECIGDYILGLDDDIFLLQQEDGDAIISGLFRVFYHLIKEDYDYLEFEMY